MRVVGCCSWITGTFETMVVIAVRMGVVVARCSVDGVVLINNVAVGVMVVELLLDVLLLIGRMRPRMMVMSRSVP